ncbi:GntR family transcriptional regulator [Streptomyces sp. CBMA29]|uniref:GntR family transcriptional regulator n=1 Tax=Streptomyces sp. CBMA29 TaxID=1896314 RepID=UPI001661F73A|nr:GntR family transcriptional regulator [Streptomyces sp. CBMA29]MBD0736149.1 hypothetical protein [Streptomyces sp. CBMA29]
MPEETAKAVHLYEAVAIRLAEQISQGQYPPGSMLPSETDLMNTFAISRPTARAAVAELRSMGLVESQRGKGSFVRQAARQATVDQTITRRGKRFSSYGAQFTEAGPVRVARTHVTTDEAAMIGHEDQAAFSVYRLLHDPATGTRATHRGLVPFDLAARHTQLHEDPNTGPDDIYGLLTAAGHNLTWTEYVTARPATPDDRAALQLPDAPWLLIAHRVTHSADEGPLLLETLTTSAENARLAYHLTAARAPAAARPV